MLTTKEVPLDSITLREEFKRDVFDQSKHDDLVLSIKARGILYPLIVMETPEGSTLVAGYRRYQAAYVLGLATVPCICLKVGIDDAEVIRLHENLYREDISPLAEAEAMGRLERTYHFTRSKIANLLGKSASYVTQRLQILTWHPELKRVLSLNSINYSVARELSAVTDDGSLRSMIEQIISAGASVRTVANWVIEWKADVVAAADKQSVAQPRDETKPTQEGQPSCFTCGLYISGDNRIRIDLCPDCLEIVEKLRG